MKIGGAIIGVAVGLLVGISVPRPWHHPFRAEAHGAKLVSFDGGAIGEQEFAGRAASQPPAVRAMLTAPAQRKAFVENLVKFELLAKEAVRKGYHQDPQFIQESKQRLGQIIFDKEGEAPLKAKAPTEDDLKRFFEQNKAALSRPERIRIAAISFAASVSNGEPPFMTRAELAARYGEPKRTCARSPTTSLGSGCGWCSETASPRATGTSRSRAGFIPSPPRPRCRGSSRQSPTPTIASET